MSISQIVESQMRRSAHDQSWWYIALSTPIALLFEFVSGLRNFLFDRNPGLQHRLPGLTWSVGNLEVGGTGKTPVVGYLANGLSARGFRPAILTRGYGTRIPSNETLWIENGTIRQTRTGKPFQLAVPDEARMMSVQCPGIPVLCSPNRRSAAHWLVNKAGTGDQPTHWILDDGFQHRRLRRDREIVVVNGTKPYGNGWCMPRGSLRESVGGIWRGDLVVSTSGGREMVGSVGKPAFELVPTDAILKIPSADGLKVLTGSLSGTVTVMTAIARPERVLQTLESRFGVIPERHVFKKDHVAFLQSEVEDVLRSDGKIVITEKDYWRHPAVWHVEQGRVLVLELRWHINDTIWAKLLD